MTSRLFRAYCRLVLRHPLFWLAAVGALCAVAAWQATDFKLDASAESLTLENDKALEYYREIAKQYGGSDFVVVTYTPKDRPLFQQDTLRHIQALQDELKGVDRVGSVYSFLDVPLLFSPKVAFTDLSDGYRTLRDPGVDLGLAKQEFTEENPLYEDLLVSEDGGTTALLLTFERDERYYELLNRRNALRESERAGELSDQEAEQLEQVAAEFSDYHSQVQARTQQEVSEIRGIMDGYRDQAQLFLGGVPMIASDMIRFIESDLKVFGLGVLIFLVLTLFLIFRRPRWVVVPLACCAVTALAVTGWLGWMDWKVTVISSNYLSLLLIITMSITIHLTVRYRELHEENPDADQAWLLKETAAHMMRPSIYMVLTTMVGFSSLVISDIRPVIDFGWMMTIGIGVALVTCFLLFPALLAPLSPGRPRQGRDLTRSITLAFAGFADRGRLPLLLLTGLALIAAVWGMTRLTVETRFIDYFQEDTEIYQGMLQIDRKLGGTTPLDIVIDAPEEQADNTPRATQQNSGDTAQSADGFEAVEADPFADDGDGAVANGDDGFGAVEDDPFASNGDDGFGEPAGDDPFADSGGSGQARASDGPNLKGAYWYTPQRLDRIIEMERYLESLPETGKVLSIATTYEVAKKINEGPLSYVQLMLLASFIPDDLRSQLVSPYLSDDGRHQLLEQIRADMLEKFDLQPEQLHLTGAMVLYNNMLQSLFDSQIKTLGYVFAAIMLMLLVLFRSLPVALISMVPSLVSAASVLGLMGWIGLPLDLMTITIGIAVDDTIHYVHRFHEELPRDGDYRATVRRCHGSIGKAMYYTSLVIIAGFSILSLSNFNPSVYFGLLTGLAMLVALLSNLTLLPALLMSVKPKLRAGPTTNMAE